MRLGQMLDKSTEAVLKTLDASLDEKAKALLRRKVRRVVADAYREGWGDCAREYVTNGG